MVWLCLGTKKTLDSGLEMVVFSLKIPALVAASKGWKLSHFISFTLTKVETQPWTVVTALTASQKHVIWKWYDAF